MSQHHVARRLQPVQNGIKLMMVSFMVMMVSGMLMAVPSLAGGKGKHHGHNPEKKLERMTKRLGLSPDQQSKVKTILEEKHHKLQELHQQMKEIRQNAHAQIKAVLTPEQQEKFKQNPEKRKHGKKKGKRKHGKKHNNDDDEREDH